MTIINSSNFARYINEYLAFQSSSPTVKSIFNSTINILNANATYTGRIEDVSAYNFITINIVSNVASAVDGVIIEFGNNNNNLDMTEIYTYDPNVIFNNSILIKAKYFRLKYINGSSVQNNLFIFTSLSSFPKDEKTLDGSQIISENSTTTMMNADASFIGSIVDISSHQYININISSNVNSAPNGIILQFGNTSTNLNIKQVYTYEAGVLFNKSFKITAKYFRLTYINGPSDQSSFSIYTSVSNYIQEVPLRSESTIDSFGRIRTSQTTTLLDVTHVVNKNPFLMDEKIVGTATSIHNVNTSCVNMAVSANNDRVLRQSRKYCVYQPSKSLSIKMTGILDDGNNGADTISRIGYYDSNNGFFFEYSNNIVYIVQRSKSTGVVIDTKIPQNEWNINPLNDVSHGYIFNPSKTQIFSIEMQWLGVGRIRCGLFHNGNSLIIHEFIHDNRADEVYITNANLPISYEIISTGGIGQMKAICASVASEGGYEALGETFSASRLMTPISINSTERPIISIRLKSARNKTKVIPRRFGLFNSSNSTMIYFVRYYLAPSVSPLTGASWASPDALSAVEYDVSSTAINTANSTILQQDYFTNKVSISIESIYDIFSEFIHLTSSIDGISDIVVISAISLSGVNQDVYGSIGWSEVF